MIRHLRAFYNKWFILPFTVWVLIGAVLMMIFSRRILFSTVNLHHTQTLDVVMSLLTELGNGWGVIAVLTMLLGFRACRNWWYFFAAVMCNAVPALAIQLLKALFQVRRPFKYYHDTGTIDWIHFNPAWGEPLWGDNSFPSGHSAGIFSLCCFLSLILPAHRSGWGLAFFFLALLVGYTRMYLAAHFYADVYVGSILGTTITLFCFALVRRWGKDSYNIITRRNNGSTLI